MKKTASNTKIKRIIIILAIIIIGFIIGRIGMKLFMNALVGGVLF